MPKVDQKAHPISRPESQSTTSVDDLLAVPHFNPRFTNFDRGLQNLFATTRHRLSAGFPAIPIAMFFEASGTLPKNLRNRSIPLSYWAKSPDSHLAAVLKREADYLQNEESISSGGVLIQANCRFRLHQTPSWVIRTAAVILTWDIVWRMINWEKDLRRSCSFPLSPHRPS